MSRAAVLTLALALAFPRTPEPTSPVGDDAADHAFVEVVADPASPFVGQPLRVTVRFGFTTGWQRDHVVPLFAQPLDVPVQIELPWLEKPTGVKVREPAPGRSPDEPLRCALDDDVATVRRGASERRDGREFDTFELVRDCLPERAGPIAIAAPTLRFAWASRFDDDLLRGRVPRDRAVTIVRGLPVQVHVAALPDQGRPAGFGGAVGTLAIHAELAARAPSPDGTLRLTVTIEGSGNLEAFETPAFPELAPFHRVGTLEEKSTTRRRLLCDLEVRDPATKEVPALAFAFFDPTPPAQYRVVHTDPIALAGLAGATAGSASPPPPPTTNGGGASSSSLRVALPIVTAAFALLAIVVVLLRRARRDADPADARAAAAAATFAERARAPGADLAEALADYLAARLATTTAAVIAPDLPARLRERAIAPELAARAAATLQALVAARYGAGRPAPTQEVPRLVRELEAAFAAAAADRSADASRR